MKMLKITKHNSIYFELSDGRIGVVYKSGYVRVTTKGSNTRFYQINKKIKTGTELNYSYSRTLVSNAEDRIKTLFEFNQKNCI